MKTKDLRAKPGRKPLQDKKEPVTVYVRKSEIKRHGGRERLRERINEIIQTLIY